MQADISPRAPNLNTQFATAGAGPVLDWGSYPLTSMFDGR